MVTFRKLWVFRKDGFRQRYRTSRRKLKARGFKYNRRSKTWDRPPTKLPKPVAKEREKDFKTGVGLVRQTLAINYVVRNTYYSIVLQAWSKSEKALRSSEGAHKEELVRELERVVGWRRDEWWFVYQIGIGYQVVPYDKFLDGRKEIRNERRGG